MSGRRVLGHGPTYRLLLRRLGRGPTPPAHRKTDTSIGDRSHENLRRLSGEASAAIRPGRLYRHQPDLPDFPCDADRPGRADDFRLDLLRQYQPRRDRDDAAVSARVVRDVRHALGTVPVLLEPDHRRRFRSFPVGFPDTGVRTDPAGAALDHWAAGGGDRSVVAAWQFAGRSGGILQEEQGAEGAGACRDGASSDALLRRGLRAAG